MFEAPAQNLKRSHAAKVQVRAGQKVFIVNISEGELDLNKGYARAGLGNGGASTTRRGGYDD